MLLRQIVDDSLSQYAYLIGCQRTGEALIVDPERDVDRYVEAAAAEGLRLTAAAETHIHADFISGARELAARGAVVWLSKAGGDDWQYAWPRTDRADVRLLGDGDTFHVGSIEIRAIHTPGHTPEHLSFLVTDRGAGADAPLGVATGDFVFVGDVGRPDLLESAAGQAGAARPAAARLRDSLQRFAALDDAVLLWPGHGAGSACGKSLGAVPISSIGYERRFNPVLRLALDDPAAFIDAILDGQPEPPPYFAAMKRLNREGPPLVGSAPAPARLTRTALAAHLRRPDVVVLDARPSRQQFMARHLRGALFTPLDRQFSTVVGSYVTADQAIILVVEAGEVDDAARRLRRIGFDRVVGYVTPDALEEILASSADGAAGADLEVASIPVIDFATMVQSGDAIVDVRSAGEHAAGHLAGAINIPHTRIATRLAELPRSRRLDVHCASGVRAAAAAAALARHGFDVAWVDGHYANVGG